ncbi:unnamed protein product [Ectocarpus sp. 13 AM-2016]
MKAWPKVTLWSRRSSKSSKSKTPSSEEPAQAEEIPVQVAHNNTILFVDGREGRYNFSRFGQTLAYGNQEKEEEKTTVDSSHRAYGAKELVSEEECRGEDCPNVRLLRKQELLRKSDQEELQKLRATLLQQKHDLQRNEKVASVRLKAVEDEKDALEVALGAETANTATQQKAMYTLRGENIEAQSVEMELRNQVETLKKEKSQAEKELDATLLQLKYDLERSEKVAVARLKEVEDEKDALEVALGAERANSAMQQKTIDCMKNTLREKTIEAQLLESELGEQVETLKKEKSKAAENGKRQTKEEKIRNGLARLVEKDLRKQVATLEQSIKELSQAAEDGQRQTKEEKVRNGLTRLVEKDLRKQVASLEQSRRQQADEIRNLLAQLQHNGVAR